MGMQTFTVKLSNRNASNIVGGCECIFLGALDVSLMINHEIPTECVSLYSLL